MKTTEKKIVPPRKKIDYNKIKHSCINGISCNLCDMISEEYGGRCGCVERHFLELKQTKTKNIKPC